MAEVITLKFIRKPLVVDAVKVTPENFEDVAKWCQGEIILTATEQPAQVVNPSACHIVIRVHNPKTPRQTKAFVGDWLLYTERGYKIYTQKAFANSFDPVT